MATPKLLGIDVVPEVDPYHRDTHTATRTAFYLNPEDSTYWIEQEYDDNATSSLVWHHRLLGEILSIRPDENQVGAYLEHPDTLALINRVIGGYECEWDGNNLRGSLDDDAQTAWDQLVTELNDLSESCYTLWTVDEWLAQADLDITIETTNVDLKSLAQDLEAQAEQESVVLDGNVLNYVTDIRDDLLENEYGMIGCKQAGHILGLSAAHIRRLIGDGAIKAKKHGHDWLIDPRDLRDVERAKPGPKPKAA